MARCCRCARVSERSWLPDALSVAMTGTLLQFGQSKDGTVTVYLSATPVVNSCGRIGRIESVVSAAQGKGADWRERFCSEFQSDLKTLASDQENPDGEFDLVRFEDKILTADEACARLGSLRNKYLKDGVLESSGNAWCSGDVAEKLKLISGKNLEKFLDSWCQLLRRDFFESEIHQEICLLEKLRDHLSRHSDEVIRIAQPEEEDQDQDRDQEPEEDQDAAACVTNQSIDQLQSFATEAYTAKQDENCSKRDLRSIAVRIYADLQKFLRLESAAGDSKNRADIEEHADIQSEARELSLEDRFLPESDDDRSISPIMPDDGEATVWRAPPTESLMASLECCQKRCQAAIADLDAELAVLGLTGLDA